MTVIVAFGCSSTHLNQPMREGLTNPPHLFFSFLPLTIYERGEKTGMKKALPKKLTEKTAGHEIWHIDFKSQWHYYLGHYSRPAGTVEFAMDHRGRTARMIDFVVDPGLRGQGKGRTLLQAARNHLQKRGYSILD